MTVHYTGWTTDGKMFDSSVPRGKPATFPLDRVIAGWTEGVQLMVEGEKRRFWIPEALAYKGQREPKGMLVFDVELISFMPSPTQPPPDVKAAPADAKKTVERPRVQGAQRRAPAPGTRAPAAPSRCTTRAGRRTARCSTARSRGASRRSFPLDGVIKGWTEGLQLMVEGEKTRFWIPESLAYRARARRTACWCSTSSCIKIN